MKTITHIAIILLVGIGLGLAIRVLSPSSRTMSAVPPDAAMFSNDDPNIDPAAVTEDEPSMAPAGWMTEFELTERSGETVGSADLIGTPYVASFFFTTCPSVCVQQNQKVKQLQDRFKGQSIKFVSITVDPENDTPEALREYAARYDADPEQWLFLTGELGYIRRVAGEVFRVAAEKQFHVEKFALVGADGQIIGFYAWPEAKQFERLQTDIAKLLETAS